MCDIGGRVIPEGVCMTGVGAYGLLLGPCCAVT